MRTHLVERVQLAAKMVDCRLKREELLEEKLSLEPLKVLSLPVENEGVSSGSRFSMASLYTVYRPSASPARAGPMHSE